MSGSRNRNAILDALTFSISLPPSLSPGCKGLMAKKLPICTLQVTTLSTPSKESLFKLSLHPSACRSLLTLAPSSHSWEGDS